MLEIKNLTKIYKSGDLETRALDDVSISFRKQEFVAILGQSGSGKTTFLNIVGGLDRYTSGDLLIKGKSTKNFKDKDWDAYRNNSIGFVFQDYDLISHLSVLQNVELGMELSGKSKKVRKQRALEVLNQVGLKDHVAKRPNQLSGGQMQRVAIARALANDPEILLCDEPTGALDSHTAVEVMNLIKSISNDRLVIMVTHNPELAEKYSDRIVRFSDGKIIDDTNPELVQAHNEKFELKRSAMSFISALSLSGTNLLTKKFRTFLTAFASSIGIIAIAVVLSLSNGFNIKIQEFETDALAEFPIIITQSSSDVDFEQMNEAAESRRGSMASLFGETDEEDVVLPEKIIVDDRSDVVETHSNIFSDEYMDYIYDLSQTDVSHIGFARLTNINAIENTDGEYKPLNLNSLVDTIQNQSAGSSGGGFTSMANAGLSTYPDPIGDNGDYLPQYYNLLYGSFPQETNDAILVIGEDGKIDQTILEKLGLDDLTDEEELDFSIIDDLKIKIANNDDYYSYVPLTPAMLGAQSSTDLGADLSSSLSEENLGESLSEGLTEDLGASLGADATAQLDASLSENLIKTEGNDFYYIPNTDYKAIYNSNKSKELNIVGVVSLKEGEISLLNPGLAFSDELMLEVIDQAKSSSIVKDQEESDYSVFPSETTASKLTESEKDMILETLGANAQPFIVMIYPTDFDGKNEILNYLDDWNEDHNETDKVIYTDLAGSITDMTSGIMDAITYALIGFAGISLVVTLLMVALLTYTSVLERTKEIGILRALGARKKDITRVFNAENFIIGAFSASLGIAIAYALVAPINVLIKNLSGLSSVALLDPVHATILWIITVLLIMLGGFTPSKMAAKKDTVAALRSE